MNIEEILKKLSANQPLSDSERTYFTDSVKGLISGKAPEGENLSYDQFSNLFKAYDNFKNTPESKQLFADIVRDKNADRFTKRYKPFFNALLQGADIATSLGQIRASNKALKAIAKPSLPVAPGIDPALNNEIYKAQQGNFDAARALAPAQQEIRDQYAKDLQTARTVSGGQSSTYGSLAQNASLNRMRGAAQLPGIADSIKREQQRRLDGLIAQRGQYAQNNFNNQLATTNLALDQYNRNVQAAGGLGATGRLNLRNTLSTVPDNLLGVASRLMPVRNPYSQPIPEAGTIYSGSPFSDYENKVNQSLADNITRINQKPIPTYPR